MLAYCDSVHNDRFTCHYEFFYCFSKKCLLIVIQFKIIGLPVTMFTIIGLPVIMSPSVVGVSSACSCDAFQNDILTCHYVHNDRITCHCVHNDRFTCHY